MPESGRVGGIPLVPPSQPTQAPVWVAITGRSAVTSPPGDSSQPSSPMCTGSRLATATTGRSPSLGAIPGGVAVVVAVTAAVSLIGVNRIVIGYPALLTRNTRGDPGPRCRLTTARS